MTIVQIPKRIIRTAVSTDVKVQAPPQVMHEKLERPRVLPGNTYRLKSPLTKSGSLWITINHLTLNEGTEREQKWPWEIFLNGKDADSYQWVVALMLVVSAVFRKGGDVTFIVEELRSVFDPNGGYLSRDGYIPSLVAEIGMTIEEDFKSIGLIKSDEALVETLSKKRAEYESEGGSMDNAAVCKKCQSKSVVMASGCAVCLSCGESKCG